MARRQTVSIDFDGTICEHRFPEIGPIKPGAKEALTRLITTSKRWISSCRASALFKRGPDNPYVDAMEKCLKDNEIPYTRIDRGDEGKVVAIAYVDDRGIRFEDNWPEIAEALCSY